MKKIFLGGISTIIALTGLMLLPTISFAQVVTDQHAVNSVVIDGSTYATNAEGQIVSTASVVSVPQSAGGGSFIVNNSTSAAPTTTYLPVGSYVPTDTSRVPGNQPVVTGGGGYEPVLTPQAWLELEVLKPALGSVTGYVDPSLMKIQLTQAVTSYCQGVANGGPNNPCGGSDLNSIVNNLTQVYTTQMQAQGGTPTINLSNAPAYVFTSYAPGYNSGGLGLILLPDGTKVPNTTANLALSQSEYNQSIGLPANYQNSSGSSVGVSGTTGTTGSAGASSGSSYTGSNSGTSASSAAITSIFAPTQAISQNALNNYMQASGLLPSAGASSAATAANTTAITNLQSQINTLTAQIKDLQARLSALTSSGSSSSSSTNTTSTPSTTSTSVSAGATSGGVTITSISPSSGVPGTVVTLTGSGFTALNNTVNIDTNTAVPGTVSSNNGTSLSFSTGAYANNPCPSTNNISCLVPITVTNTNGTSNSVTFFVQTGH
jgi:hypothetical protein